MWALCSLSISCSYTHASKTALGPFPSSHLNHIFDLLVLFFSKSEKFNEILSLIPNAQHTKTTTTTEWSTVDIHNNVFEINLNSLLCPILHPSSMCSKQKNKIKSAFAERRASQKFTVSASAVRVLPSIFQNEQVYSSFSTEFHRRASNTGHAPVPVILIVLFFFFFVFGIWSQIVAYFVATWSRACAQAHASGICELFLKFPISNGASDYRLALCRFIVALIWIFVNAEASGFRDWTAVILINWTVDGTER